MAYCPEGQGRRHVCPVYYLVTTAMSDLVAELLMCKLITNVCTWTVRKRPCHHNYVDIKHIVGRYFLSSMYGTKQ